MYGLSVDLKYFSRYVDITIVSLSSQGSVVQCMSRTIDNGITSSIAIAPETTINNFEN